MRFADLLFRLARWMERAGTVGHNDKTARRFGAFGESSALVYPPGALFGEKFIHIGAHTLIGPHVTMSAGLYGEELHTATGWSLRIGDRCSVGRDSYFVSRIGIDVGDDVTMAPNVYVTDHNHRYDDPDTPITRQWVDSDPVSIGPGCWLGARAIVLPGTTLGRNVVVAGGSVVRGEVPDHAVVAGVPAKVVRRYEDGGWIPPLTDQAGDVPPAGWPDDS